GSGLQSLQPQAIEVLDTVPRATAKFSAALRLSARGPPGAVEKMQRAASEIEKAAHAAATTSTAPKLSAGTSVRAPADASTFNIWDYVVMGTASAVAGVGPVGRVVAPG